MSVRVAAAASAQPSVRPASVLRPSSVRAAASFVLLRPASSCSLARLGPRPLWPVAVVAKSGARRLVPSSDSRAAALALAILGAGSRRPLVRGTDRAAPAAVVLVLQGSVHSRMVCELEEGVDAALTSIKSNKSD